MEEEPGHEEPAPIPMRHLLLSAMKTVKKALNAADAEE